MGRESGSTHDENAARAATCSGDTTPTTLLVPGSIATRCRTVPDEQRRNKIEHSYDPARAMAHSCFLMLSAREQVAEFLR